MRLLRSILFDGSWTCGVATGGVELIEDVTAAQSVLLNPVDSPTFAESRRWGLMVRSCESSVIDRAPAGALARPETDFQRCTPRSFSRA